MSPLNVQLADPTLRGALNRTECLAAPSLFQISLGLLLVSAFRIHGNCSAWPDAADLQNHFFVLRAVVVDFLLACESKIRPRGQGR